MKMMMHQDIFFEEIIDKSVGVADDEESFATTSNLQMFLNESFAKKLYVMTR